MQGHRHGVAARAIACPGARVSATRAGVECIQTLADGLLPLWLRSYLGKRPTVTYRRPSVRLQSPRGLRVLNVLWPYRVTAHAGFMRLSSYASPPGWVASRCVGVRRARSSACHIEGAVHCRVECPRCSSAVRGPDVMWTAPGGAGPGPPLRRRDSTVARRGRPPARRARSPRARDPPSRVSPEPGVAVRPACCVAPRPPPRTYRLIIHTTPRPTRYRKQ